MNGFLMALSLIIFSVNIYFIFWIYRGLKRVAGELPPPPSSPKSFSIIIAARNEAHKIDRCLRALADQNYPKDKYEIIVVADRCTDNTVQVANQLREEFDRFKIIEIREVTSGISPKKHALARGIAEATFDRFLFIDADVVPSSNHIQTMNKYFNEGGDAVVGIMKLNLRDGFWPDFLKYERLLNWSAAAGSIAKRKPMISYGGDWGYTRGAFEKVDGFEGIFKSPGGDDDLLLQKFGREGLDVRFCANPEGWVSTDGPDSFGKFLRQRRRHLAAGRYYQIGFKLGYFIFHTSNALIWVMPFVYPISVSLLLLKFICNAALLNMSKRIFKEKLNPFYIPFLELLFMLYSILMGMIGFLGRVRW